MADLPERLRNMRVVLKSGDYDGADLMRAWCAMTDAADALEALTAQVAVMGEALEPFDDFADNVDDVGWASDVHKERISYWFGPSDFRKARRAARAAAKEPS